VYCYSGIGTPASFKEHNAIVLTTWQPTPHASCFSHHTHITITLLRLHMNVDIAFSAHTTQPAQTNTTAGTVRLRDSLHRASDCNPTHHFPMCNRHTTAGRDPSTPLLHQQDFNGADASVLHTGVQDYTRGSPTKQVALPQHEQPCHKLRAKCHTSKDL
jgi:hypothetical protein